MTKNIKEIGKELLGKSLNSFHRKTGLTQLEENNKMQDGILNGILSQVDDAYIEKTEQSNVIHLDGSGDGVVVLDSIEGNTMVNLFDNTNILNKETEIPTNKLYVDYSICKVNKLKTNTTYTFIIKFSQIVNSKPYSLGFQFGVSNVINHTLDHPEFSDGKSKYYTFTLNSNTLVIKTSFSSFGNYEYLSMRPVRIQSTSGVEDGQTLKFTISECILLEGDYTDKDIKYFEGLQSSFEEKVNDEGKYEIEILSNNSNLLSTIEVKQNHTYNEVNPFSVYVSEGNQCSSKPIYIKHLQNKYIHIQRTLGTMENTHHASLSFYDEFYNKIRTSYDNAVEVKQLVPSNAWYCAFRCKSDNKVLYLGEYRDYYIEPKQNKIKLLINEPLRAIETFKDKLCVKDGQLVVERNLGEDIFDGSERWEVLNYPPMQNGTHYQFTTDWSNKANGIIWGNSEFIKCDRLTTVDHRTTWSSADIDGIGGDTNRAMITFKNSTSPFTTISEVKQWLSQNPLKVVYPLAEPYYEEVLNEYGEPIILEGYENGTLYIDSTIVPSITVRYTPKMESLNTLKEVNNNNVMLTNDINDMIVPYMMEVDLMIMEKEFALMSAKNIRKVGEKDMTSMQKRTQQMLERLVKGKTLTEQECQTRVTTYLNANKITDEQAEELNFLIDEIYA